MARGVEESLGDAMTHPKVNPQKDMVDLAMQGQESAPDTSWPVEHGSAESDLPENCRGAALRAYVTARIEGARPGETPFRHLYIEDVFPTGFYEKLRAHMLAKKYRNDLSVRHQDSPNFQNKRFNLADGDDPIINEFTSTFLNVGVKGTLLYKFYLDPIGALNNSLVIHDEFEYFFTESGRFQNIHVDIPPKFLSFVFYIPEIPAPNVAKEEENSTILYDEDMIPQRRAKFKPNSVCVFAPHFLSYHGFNSTLDRDVLVMFYVDPDELVRWRALRQHPEEPPFDGIRDAIESKLRRHPLIEFGQDPEALRSARERCRINAPQGRVL